MRRLPLLNLAAAALVAGCTVGPRYRSPSVAPLTPAGFAESSAATAAAPPPGRWWRLYDDPNIDPLVQQALAANTDLRQAAANLAEARGALEEARAGLFPSTGTAAAASYGRSAVVGGAAATAASSTASTGSASSAGGATSGGGGSEAGGASAGGGGPTTGGTQTGGGVSSGGGGSGLRSQWIYSAALDASYEVDLFGRIRRGVQAARADVETQAAAVDLARTSVAAETTRAYVDACTYAEQADVARRNLDLVTQSYELTVRQRDLGSVSDYEVSNARALVEQTRATLPTFEGERRAALYSLAVLTGRPPEEVSPAAAACRKPPKLTQPIPVGDGAGLLRRRPDVRQAERALAAAVDRIGVATADLYPTVLLGGGISSAGAPEVGFGSTAGTAFSLGPLISWTFPNLIAAHARIREAGALADVQLAAFDGTVLAALQDTEQSLATYGAELDRHAALQAARDQAATAFRLANLRAQAGSISGIDLITVERTLVGAEADLAASDAALATDQINVFKALGGGWEDAPPIRHAPLPTKTNGGKVEG